MNSQPSLPTTDADNLGGYCLDSCRELIATVLHQAVKDSLLIDQMKYGNDEPAESVRNWFRHSERSRLFCGLLGLDHENVVCQLEKMWKKVDSYPHTGRNSYDRLFKRLHS